MSRSPCLSFSTSRVIIGILFVSLVLFEVLDSVSSTTTTETRILQRNSNANDVNSSTSVIRSQVTDPLVSTESSPNAITGGGKKKKGQTIILGGRGHDESKEFHHHHSHETHGDMGRFARRMADGHRHHIDTMHHHHRKVKHGHHRVRRQEDEDETPREDIELMNRFLNEDEDEDEDRSPMQEMFSRLRRMLGFKEEEENKNQLDISPLVI